MNRRPKKHRAFKVNIDRHLAQLSRLLGRVVRAESLLSLSETELLRTEASAVKRVPRSRHTFDFVEKRGPWFGCLLRQLAQANPTDVYVWTPFSNVCGLHPAVPLSSVRLGFDFDLIPEGALVLLPTNLEDRMLLDYSEDAGGKERIVMELEGPAWGTIDVPAIQDRTGRK